MFKTSFLTNYAFNTLIRTCSHFNSLPIAQIIQNNKPGDVIRVKGWVKSLRNQKENVFIDLNDGSTEKKLQIFIPKNNKPNDLTTGASITAFGSLNLSPKGQIELTAEKVEVCGKCVVADGYPFAPRKQYPPEYIRQFLHFRPRTNKFGALMRVRSAATLAFFNYFHRLGFINVATPVLTSNDCEGAGEVFKVLPENKQLVKSMIKEKQSDDEAYFDCKTFLTVSGQLHLEAAACGLSKVFTFGPTFRAENSRSRLHLSEFYMLEAEIAFIEGLNELISFTEDLVKNVTRTLLDQNHEDLHICGDNGIHDLSWIDKKFPVLTYDESVSILNSNKNLFKESFDSKNGFAKEHELFLVKHCGNVPVFVINWPKEMKSFYMKECESDKVAALDLLAPNVGEIVGGSLRENDYDKLKRKIPQNSLYLDWYLDIRKFGGVSTGGFGLGFERYLQLILGINNIKDTIPFPRWPHNCAM